MKKKTILYMAAALAAMMSVSSCTEKNITLEDLSGSSSKITLTCNPKTVNVKVNESADIVVEVSGAKKDSPVSCLSSNPNVAEAYEADARTVRVRGVAPGTTSVAVSCENSDAVNVEVRVTD